MNSRFGLSPSAPLQMVEEYVGVVRSVLKRGTGYDGQLFRTGLIPLDSPPARADPLPIRREGLTSNLHRLNADC